MKKLGAIISQHPFVEGLAQHHVEIIAGHATEVSFETGQVVFREGEVAWQFYLILRGKVALGAGREPNGHTVVQEVGEGQVLGWSWLYQPFHWHFTARAVEPTEAVLLDGCRLLIACEEDHDFGYELMKRISQLVIQRLESAQRLLEREEDKSVAA